MDCKYGFQSILFFLVASFCASANVLDFKVSKQFRVQGTFKEVCETMGYSDNLLIEAKGLVALDCMGRVVKINDFCLRKKEKKRVFLRGYLNPKDSSVICQYGNSASLSLSCETKKTRDYCASPGPSCSKLRKFFAKELDVTHHSRLFKDGNETLHCYFGKLNFDLDKDLFDSASPL